MRTLTKIAIWTVGLFLVACIALVLYVRAVSRVHPPDVKNTDLESRHVVRKDSILRVLGPHWLRKSKSGLYELYVEGEPYERGVANGKLTRDLVQYQEAVFNDQINTLVPSGFYRGMLKYFVGWYNRDMDTFIPEEFKEEIYGISKSASREFDAIAPAYQRLLNYHAAHDIGHALQNMSLVGCTSFATWGDRSEDGGLILGRNFDFYVGDEFAEHKIIAFYRPDRGHPFMMVTFGGMTGVLSGMNNKGLTVTINAAKSDIPSGARMPVSLVAREILQYASTIGEAYAIAQKRKMFVSESFLIGSASDGRAAIIEKSPDGTDLVESTGDQIVCTNHFQGNLLGATDLNEEHIRTSASSYRYQRVQELLKTHEKNSIPATVKILRDQKGLDDTDIGLGNEKAINQLIAHHGIIFQPEELRVWISTSPWQLGSFVCYNLADVFALSGPPTTEIMDSTRSIPADPFLQTQAFGHAVKFNRYRFPFMSREGLDPDSVIAWNPDSYHAYMLAADHCRDHDEPERAARFYEIALTKEIATVQEREYIEKNLRAIQSGDK